MPNTNSYIFQGDKVILEMKDNKRTIISQSSFEKIWFYTWCVEGTGYVMSRTSGEAVKLHRLIMNANHGEYVDHIDGNPLNNTLENLRICEKKQNEYNQKIRKDNSSGFKGVCLHKQSGKFRAYIVKDGHQYSLGLYATKYEAALAYNNAAIKLFGEFAKINSLQNEYGCNYECEYYRKD